MPRIQLTPQRREFFRLYSRASANTVEIAQQLVRLLDEFEQNGETITRERLVRYAVGMMNCAVGML